MTPPPPHTHNLLPRQPPRRPPRPRPLMHLGNKFSNTCITLGGGGVTSLRLRTSLSLFKSHFANASLRINFINYKSLRHLSSHKLHKLPTCHFTTPHFIPLPLKSLHHTSPHKSLRKSLHKVSSTHFAWKHRLLYMGGASEQANYVFCAKWPEIMQILASHFAASLKLSVSS